MWFCRISIAFHSLVLGTHSCWDGEAAGAGITERPLPSLLLGDLQSQNLHLFISGVGVVPNPPQGYCGGPLRVGSPCPVSRVRWELTLLNLREPGRGGVVTVGEMGEAQCCAVSDRFFQVLKPKCHDS